MESEAKTMNITVSQTGTLFMFEPEEGTIPTDKFACFDLDWTLSFGQAKLYPSDPEDIYMLPKRRAVLKQLVADGWSIVIFTNQYAVSKKERTKRCGRIQTAISKMGVPCWVFMAVGKDKKEVIDMYRKPAIGMWTEAVELLGEPTESFYCGDAAGRPQDFSDSDRKFAENAGIEFKTPEEVFPVVASCKPRKGKELVVFVGMPGCGKSTYCNEHFSDYVRVNQDILKTRAKVLWAIRNAVAEGKSVVVDATNPALETRQEYYEIVKNMDYKITVIYFVRDGRGWNALRTQKVPTIVYHKYFKNLDPPTKAEIPGSDEFRGKLRRL
jgi:bifunctional polynucleotide phosphatase/kinase